MKICHMMYPYDGGCSFHRHLQPARFCGPKFRELGWDIQIGASIESKADVLFWHGLPMDADTMTAVMMALARSKVEGKKFVWSVDDDWLTVPEWNPARPSAPSMSMYYMLREMSDYIVCSTQHLANTFDTVEEPEKVLVAPNMVDLELFPKPELREDDKGFYPVMQPPKGPVRVVWSGGPTHKEDLDVMTEALSRLLDKYGQERCVVLFNGMPPPPKLMTKYLHRGLFHQPIVPFASYQKILNSVEAHVYLAPQSEVEFNLSKSNLRIMEAWGLRAAPVASEWGEYACIENGKDGRLVSNDPDQWYSALQRLVTDHETRIQMALRGYCRVDAKYNWQREECRMPWYRAFATIFGIEL